MSGIPPSVHRETREQSVYALVVGKGGLKIKEAALEEEPSAGFNFCINNDGSGATISSGATGNMRMTQVQAVGCSCTLQRSPWLDLPPG